MATRSNKPNTATKAQTDAKPDKEPEAQANAASNPPPVEDSGAASASQAGTAPVVSGPPAEQPKVDKTGTAPAEDSPPAPFTALECIRVRGWRYPPGAEVMLSGQEAARIREHEKSRGRQLIAPTAPAANATPAANAEL